MESHVTHQEKRVLIVDDEADQLAALSGMIASFGIRPITAVDGQDALDKLATREVDVILTDLIMPRMDGFELLQNLSRNGNTTPTVVLTAFGNLEKAISVVHEYKAFWFLEKPAQPGILGELMERAIVQNRLRKETLLLHRQLGYLGKLGEMVGSSPAMQQVYVSIQQVAPTSAPVFLTGETGTGKELAVRAIHRLSGRSGPFVAVNCAALTETLIESELFGYEKGAFTGAAERRAGCFEHAQGGTILLDEIGDMPIGTQSKLLRVLETSSVRRVGGKHQIDLDVRVVAATNQTPQEAIRNHRLREDLYYRLNVFHIPLPPLREHKEDIPAIVDALIEQANRKHNCRVTGLNPDALDVLQAHNWPGNVRELRNVVERAVVLSGEGSIPEEHLRLHPQLVARVATEVPTENILRLPVGRTLQDVEKDYIQMTLRHANNNKRRAAAILGVSPRTLYKRLAEFRSEEMRAASASG